MDYIMVFLGSLLPLLLHFIGVDAFSTKAVAVDTTPSTGQVHEQSVPDSSRTHVINGEDMSPYDIDPKHLRIQPTLNYPNGRPIPPRLFDAVQSHSHPRESQEDLGAGVFIVADWRRAWFTYQSPPNNPTLINEYDGYAEYEIDEIDGILPDDLVGVLYRNGPGKFGIDGERVEHVLDADGLIIRIEIPPVPTDVEERRRIIFKSRFVETRAFREERAAGTFLERGTFGTGPRGLPILFGTNRRPGVNEEPTKVSAVSRILGNALKIDIKNTANTHVISFGGKLLALFEAGLPHAIDPETLKTLGEDDMGGILPKNKHAVKLGSRNIPEEFLPDFLGGAAHTAHPKTCPRTGHLVGWQWSLLADENSMEVTVTEWSDDAFKPVANDTFRLQGCEVAPHDMALTENCLLLIVNSLKMDQVAFMSGFKGPAASMKMDGRAPVTAHILPRPCANKQFEPFCVEVPPCFCIHFSHAYEDEKTGNIVALFSGWPPSDAKEFLGAWGGFAPDYCQIPETYIWRLEIDPMKKKVFDFSIARGSANVCAEFPVVHPNFRTKKAKNLYATVSNVVGDSSAPCGYVRLRVEDGSPYMLSSGERNEEVDAYWLGSRRFSGEPLVVPKDGGNPDNENEAYLVGMVNDSVRDLSYVAVFDLEESLANGPVCKLWLKSAVPHGLHGCFAKDGLGGKSVFC